MGQARIRKLAGDTHEARLERTPTPQRILELAAQVQERVGDDGIEFALRGGGRCWLWATCAQDVLAEHGIESRLRVGAAVASFGLGAVDVIDFGFTAGGVHYWITLADGTVVDYSVADLPTQRRGAHVQMAMTNSAMSCELPSVFDSRTCRVLSTPTSSSSAFAMLHSARGDGELARRDVQMYRSGIAA